MSASGRSVPISSDWMTDRRYSTLSELQLAGPVPRWEVPGWRARFGVVAGVTGRGDGGSGAGFDLGLWTGEPVGEVLTRWQQFLRAEPGFSGAVLSRQVHGTALAWHPAPTPGWTMIGGVDGHLSAAPELLLLVTVADCVPVYLVDPTRRALALVHAGWRGVAGGILAAAITQLQAVAGSSPQDLVMHCGVAISGACYEVEDEVAVACGKQVDGEGHTCLDLRRQLAEQADVLGVGEITVSENCTATAAEHFFSHRRSGGRDGRQVAYLGIPGRDSTALPL